MRSGYILVILLMLSVRLSYATHALGAGLTYRLLGNSQYEITYTFFRDCRGITPPFFIDLNIKDQLGIVNSISIPPIAGSPFQIQTTCFSATTTCNGGNNLGAEKWIYIDTVTLSNDIYTIYHSENARSNALTTIIPTGNNDLFVYAVINNTTGLQNSSPVFTRNPVITLCQNTQYCIPSFVEDADGDSLYFELVSPRYGPLVSDTVIYVSGHSSTQPFISNPPVTLNNSTGELCLSSANTDVSTYALLVSEYRNGVLLGQVERDIMVSMDVCTNSTPVLSGFNGIPSDTLNVCAGQQNCFYIFSSDSDAANITSISLYGLSSSATYLSSTGPRDSVFICITPNDTDTVTLVCFYGMVSDDACPVPATTYKEYCLKVTPSQICNPNAIEESISAPKCFVAHPQYSKHNVDFEIYKPDSRYTLVLYDALGKVVGKINASEPHVTMNTFSLSHGIYIAGLIDENERVLGTQKILLE
jgi:hypothetical protein